MNKKIKFVKLLNSDLTIKWTENSKDGVFTFKDKKSSLHPDFITAINSLKKSYADIILQEKDNVRAHGYEDKGKTITLFGEYEMKNGAFANVSVNNISVEDGKIDTEDDIINAITNIEIEAHDFLFKGKSSQGELFSKSDPMGNMPEPPSTAKE